MPPSTPGIAETRRQQIFPMLTEAQRRTALRFASGPVQRFAPGQTLFALGERNVPAFLILAGTLDVVQRDGIGHEGRLVRQGPGEITGEISQLAGRPTLSEGCAGPEGCEAAPFDAAHLRALVIGSAELGELVMRAYILRRTALIQEGNAGCVLIGRTADRLLVRLDGFLTRNTQPHTVLDPAQDPDAHALVERFGVLPEELPIVVCPNGTLLKRPNEAEVGQCLGITPELDEARCYDVAVVGAGPAGLATAVYAASEGLAVLVLDTRAFGGQAGASARIENYLGFPTGISGLHLTARAYTQAQKFGAEVAIPIEVAGLDCSRAGPEAAMRLTLANGRTMRARSVVIASGVRYRRPAIEGLQEYEGAGISYWASPIEARLCRGEEVALVGGGNSAGQAVVFLAPHVKHLHLLVRGSGIEHSMSRYLVDRIAALPNVTLHRRREIVGLDGTPGEALEGATFRDRDSGETFRCPVRHVFIFIGADPNTGWLASCNAAVDAKGFVLTGQASHDGRPAQPLETSIPGVFAIGDVRAGSTKRVAAAVGEGAAVVAQLHALLSGEG